MNLIDACIDQGVKRVVARSMDKASSPANILGYGYPEVDVAVIETVTKGNMSTFNCPEEVYLAEKLIEIHPWADMARFARAGGELFNCY